MPDIAIKRTHQLGLKGAKTAADKMAEKLGEKFGLAGEWDGNDLNFSRPGVSGTLAITETVMTLEVTLGFLLKAMKGPIENAVNEQLDKVLKDAKPEKAAKAEVAKKPVAKKK
jgi:putative polyhydroxyalkanoate system protein